MRVSLVYTMGPNGRSMGCRFPSGPWLLVLLDLGRTIKPGPDREGAFRRHHELMARPPESPKRLSADAILQIFDAFLHWCQKLREARRYDWYGERSDSFTSFRTDTCAIPRDP